MQLRHFNSLTSFNKSIPKYSALGEVKLSISFYADDLVLFISKPTTSLLPVFNQFGELSGYKLTKCEHFPINQRAQALDTSNLPFKIETNKFSYLGISVTRKYLYLFKKRLISNLYNIILDLRCTSTDKLKAAWEEDLGFSLSEGTWSDIFQLVNPSSLCARHCLIQFCIGLIFPG